MPFYEYECSACGQLTEVLQKISDAPLKKCPHCGKSALKRLISAPVFRLKGSGWYETDFKSDQDKKRNLAGADEAPPAKDDDKPAAKDDAKESKDKPAAESTKEQSTKEQPASTSSKKSTGKAPPAPAKKPAAKKPVPKKPAARKKAGRR
jgi:putative FmdB family regulatory protein